MQTPQEIWHDGLFHLASALLMGHTVRLLGTLSTCDITGTPKLHTDS